MGKGQGIRTYQDWALMLIDYQKEMFDQVRAETSAELIDLNVRQLIKAAKAFNMPIVLSTVGVEMGVNDGCSFFISQAVYDAGTTIRLLADYARDCEREESLRVGLF